MVLIELGSSGSSITAFVVVAASRVVVGTWDCNEGCDMPILRFGT